MRHTKKLLIAAFALGTTALVDIGPALSHAFSIGYENAGPGSVTVWLGTYPHGGHHLEGSLQLEGVNGTVFGPTVNPFGTLTADGAKPAGLIDGLTNFFVSTPLGTPGPLVGSDTIWLTSLCPACGPANHWEGVTFAGLTPGDYQFTYVPIAFPSQEWKAAAAGPPLFSCVREGRATRPLVLIEQPLAFGRARIATKVQSFSSTAPSRCVLPTGKSTTRSRPWQTGCGRRAFACPGRFLTDLTAVLSGTANGIFTNRHVACPGYAGGIPLDAMTDHVGAT